jgi:predicted TIM-barrel fold metal-dependent hydrolase
MIELGRRPNVAVKISALVSYDPHWTPDSIRPVALHCIESFGVERAMFGSDFPVAGLHASFDEEYETFKTIVADFSQSEQERLFYDNAARLYRFDGEASSAARLPA